MVIYIYDSFVDRMDLNIREDVIIPLRAFLVVIMKQVGYFDYLALLSKSDIFRAIRLPPEDVAKQVDNNSCNMFSLTFTEYIVQGKPIRKSFGQQDIFYLPHKKTLEIFANGVDAD